MKYQKNEKYYQIFKILLTFPTYSGNLAQCPSMLFAIDDAHLLDGIVVSVQRIYVFLGYVFPSEHICSPN